LLQKLLLYTDDTLLACGAESVLTSLNRFDIVIGDSETSDLIPLVQRIQPHAVLIDLTPHITIGLISALREEAPEMRIVLWGRSFSDELLNQAGEVGVAGFVRRGISKQRFLEDLMDALDGTEQHELEKPSQGTRIPLTNRESQLVTLLVQGLRNKEIGACLGITEGTVRVYLSKLFVKIGARDRFEVAVFGMKNACWGEAAWDGQNGFVTELDPDRARPLLHSLLLVEPKRRQGYLRPVRVVG